MLGHTVTDGTTFAAPECVFEKTGKEFADWNTKADGSGTAYAAGASIVANGDMKLYAQWN